MEANLRILKSIEKINKAILENKAKNEELDDKQSELQALQANTAENIKRLFDEQKSLAESQSEFEQDIIQEVNERIDTIQLTAGPKGDKGDAGYTPIKGIDYFDGRDGRDGKDGKDGVGVRGKDGKDGRDGLDGVGIYEIRINEDGDLIITLTNGRTINCGRVRGKDGMNGFSVSVVSAEIRDSHLYIKLSTGKEIDAGDINAGSVITETDPIFTKSPAYNITNEDITFWNNKSEFSGSYDDLTDKPYIPTIFYIPISSSNTTTTKWNEVYDAYTNNAIIMAKIDYLESGTTTPTTVPLYSILGNQAGGTMLFTFVMGTSTLTYMITGTGSNVCIVIKQEKNFELVSNKTQDIITNSSSTTLYPSANAVYKDFQRKPVLIYDKVNKLHIPGIITTGTDSDNGLLNQNQGEGTNRNITSWNITGMNLSEFKYIRVLFSRNDITSAITGEFNIPLDGEYITNGSLNAYVSGISMPYYAVRTRLVGIGCAISSDKTSFTITQTISLTATTLGMVATTVNDMFVIKIEGYYD